MASSPGYVPGPLVIPQTAQVRLMWTLPNGKHASNVLHALIADGFTWAATDVDDVFNAITASTPWAEYHPFLSDATSFDGIEIKDLRTPNGIGILSTAAAITGTSGADALPEGVAFCVTLRAAQTGRSNRGRVYLAGFSEDATDAVGHATADMRTAAQNFVADVLNALGVKDFNMAIAHRGHAEYVSPISGRTIPEELPGSVEVVDVRALDVVFDSQRRRK